MTKINTGLIKHASLFSGIGGFDLAAETVGWQNVFQVEKDKWCQKILAKNFPDVKKYEDIKDFDGNRYHGAIDVISGGFPCQPFSVAGKQRGTNDDRYLWPEMLRIIREIRPTWVVGENVAGIIKLALGQVLSDLETEGYTIETFIIPACAVNAPHRRDRVWVVAYANGNRTVVQKRNGNSENSQRDFTPEIQKRQNKQPGLIATGVDGQDVPDPESSEPQSRLFPRHGGGRLANGSCTISDQWDSAGYWELGTNRVVDGLPGRVDRLKGLGNAIVPQVAIEIFKAINKLHQCN